MFEIINVLSGTRESKFNLNLCSCAEENNDEHGVMAELGQFNSGNNSE